MSIYRIGKFQATGERLDELKEFLLCIVPLVKSSMGCEAVQLYQSEDDPTQFTMIEVWDHIESHRASVRNIPPELLAKIGPLLASPPSGGYFALVLAG